MIGSNYLFSTYWGSYFKNTDITLDLTPSFIDIVILAFIGPNEDSTVETEFLCSNYSKEQIIKWIDCCHKKNIKVYISLLDTPEVHWDKINLEVYAQNINKLIKEWKIDGIDIDAESDMLAQNYVNTFIQLVKSIKKYNKLPITYTCYQGTSTYDGKILQNIKNDIEYIQLMAYFDSFEGMTNLYNDYKTIMGDKILIGVKAGHQDGTDLDEVKKLCIWNNKKKGIMLWTINRDVPYYTTKDTFTWANIININLKNKFIKTVNYCSNSCFYFVNKYLNKII